MNMNVKCFFRLVSKVMNCVHLQHMNSICLEISLDPLKSKEHGNNSNSVLNELKYFHVCSGALVPDVMHDMLEGVLQYELKLLLKKFIFEDKYITLQQLNSTIQNLDFGPSESKSRPTPIESKTLLSQDNHLKQNGKSTCHCIICHVKTFILIASQMWVLGRYFPLLVGDRIPKDDELWNCYSCILLDIVQYLFAPKLPCNDLAVLEMQITSHHEKFITLYPNNSVIPKFSLSSSYASINI